MHTTKEGHKSSKAALRHLSHDEATSFSEARSGRWRRGTILALRPLAQICDDKAELVLVVVIGQTSAQVGAAKDAISPPNRKHESLHDGTTALFDYGQRENHRL